MPRARSFDEELFLDAVTERFWIHGYRGSALTDLSAATGVANGSLYQAYGSKWALFLVVFRRYCAGRLDFVEAALAPGQDVADTVRAYLAAVRADCAAHPDRRGCLMLNTIAEFGSDEEIARIVAGTMTQMEQRMAEALAEAAGRDRCDEDVVAAAANVVAISQSLIQLWRIGRDERELARMSEQVALAASGVLAA
ncbi:TetR/AcrR family transcriptional regulator [Microbacterium sp. SORGH_AS_0862]|uniref:TetR/AcrR family transcriptional regulator n=1 Tax=Microbacterium sp. SORGH_AS_0862 TaxID=3041789 RepID=UPI0027935CBE|nr:TetR/AcrR family transcriptional regulator [Microbacterium sp. SORGH_AS_0862]MDQ1206488.1 AcrR family transcriptional regulator [Microbacterium sp. SORGH_AS_0862]